MVRLGFASLYLAPNQKKELDIRISLSSRRFNYKWRWKREPIHYYEHLDAEISISNVVRHTFYSETHLKKATGSNCKTNREVLTSTV